VILQGQLEGDLASNSECRYLPSRKFDSAHELPSPHIFRVNGHPRLSLFADEPLGTVR